MEGENGKAEEMPLLPEMAPGLETCENRIKIK